MAAELVLPDLAYERSYGAYILELGEEERYPFPLDFEHKDFLALIKRLSDFANGVNIPEGFVPSSTYWLVENGELIGVSNLRHYLNERIKKSGGHIGLGVRPSCRGRGFGHLLMALTIQEARRKSIREIHIHCHKNNEASVRMIISNGGVLDSEITGRESEEIVQRYVVADASLP
jgi:predicted acetyltransferase